MASDDGLAQLDAMLGSSGTPGAAMPRGPRPPHQVDPAVRRRRRRRGLLIAAIVVVALIAGACGYAGWALNAPIGQATVHLQQPEVPTPAKAAVQLPVDGEAAISVAGADAYLGKDAAGIWQSTGDDPQPMASISKVITAMVVLQAKPLSGPNDPGPTITFDKAAHALYDQYYVLGCQIAAMPTGSSLSEHDALEVMLVDSACNYAEAVAIWAYGSEGAFDAAARSWLRANGMTHTTMVEPTGIDDRNTSTPSDLIALGKLAMANPAVASLVGIKTMYLSVDGLNGAPNTNDLLGTDGIDGIKTGTLDTGSDLLYAAQLDVGLPQPLTVVGVQLSGDDHSAVDHDVTNLLDSIRSGFHTTEVGQDLQDVGTYTTAWGASSRVLLDSSADVLTWSDAPIRVSMTTRPLTTGAAGQKVGTVTWTTSTRTVSVPVILATRIAAPTAWWRLTHPGELG